MSRRTGAIVALGAGTAALIVAAYALADAFPRGLLIFACILGAAGMAWFGLLRRRAGRLLGLVAAALLTGVAIALLASGGHLLELILVAVLLGIGSAGARRAFHARHQLPPATTPKRPVLFINPRSGDGKAAAVGLAEQARSRGIEPIELKPGDDLAELARQVVSAGADGLAMAGGDGSQAVVAAIAAEHDLPYACIPSGTRNHFALDLGVDREDVVGALDAFVDGGERRVDLAEVNGRVFVNNVSLGVYAEAVGQDRYRAAKLRTLLDTMADTLGPDGDPAELRWLDRDGEPQTSTALILVSNNPYLLGPTLGSGTRPSLDRGLLGVVDFHPPIAGRASEAARWREMTTTELEVESDAPVPVGVDGESLSLEPPLRFRSRPGALRVRIARDHPGASPSAAVPRGPLSGLKELARIAAKG